MNPRNLTASITRSGHVVTLTLTGSRTTVVASSVQMQCSTTTETLVFEQVRRVWSERPLRQPPNLGRRL